MSPAIVTPRFIHPDTLRIARLVSKATGATLAEALDDQLELFESENA